jgi:hypothetical protein
MDISIGIAAGYGLDGRGSIPGRGKTDWLWDPASYPVGTGGSFPEFKAAGRETDHSPPSSAEVKNTGAVDPLPHISSWYSA